MKQLAIVVFALLISFVGNTQVTPTKLYISSVNNLIKVGPLTNNTNLAFGVKNILEEATQDKGYSIVTDRWDADLVLDIDIIYFDIEKSQYTELLSNCLNDLIAIEEYELCAEVKKIIDKKSKKKYGDALELI